MQRNKSTDKRNIAGNSRPKRGKILDELRSSRHLGLLAQVTFKQTYRNRFERIRNPGNGSCGNRPRGNRFYGPPPIKDRACPEQKECYIWLKDGQRKHQRG